MPSRPADPATRLDEWLPLRPLAAGAAAGQAEMELAPDSPWLDGHFPESPILPGVAMLAMAWETARRHLREAGVQAALLGFRSVRFKHMVTPGARLRVSVEPAEDPRPEPGRRRLRFSIHMGGGTGEGEGEGEVICQGVLLTGEDGASSP